MTHRLGPHAPFRSARQKATSDTDRIAPPYRRLTIERIEDRLLLSAAAPAADVVSEGGTVLLGSFEAQRWTVTSSVYLSAEGSLYVDSFGSASEQGSADAVPTRINRQAQSSQPDDQTSLTTDTAPARREQDLQLNAVPELPAAPLSGPASVELTDEDFGSPPSSRTVDVARVARDRVLAEIDIHQSVPTVAGAVAVWSDDSNSHSPFARTKAGGDAVTRDQAALPQDRWISRASLDGSRGRLVAFDLAMHDGDRLQRRT
ncbi:MAG: hypothetical protein ACYC6Y_02255, partial [Thermoguttaceae bacterium]